jgi:hypothetical protein
MNCNVKHMKKLIIIISILTIPLGETFAQADSYKVTLKKMLEVAGSEASFKAAIKQMFDMFKQQKADVPDSFWDEAEKEFSQTSMDELVGMLSPVYQKYMTEEDLKKIIEFYQTPVGKKYAEKTPLIMQESMQVGQQWGMKIGQRVQERLKEKGY